MAFHEVAVDISQGFPADQPLVILSQAASMFGKTHLILYWPGQLFTNMVFFDLLESTNFTKNISYWFVFCKHKPRQ